MTSTIQYKQAAAEDAERIVELVKGPDNLYGWNLAKWQHYYQDYPEKGCGAMIAINDAGQCIGHYGLLPVSLSGIPAMLGVHAYVHPDYRGLEVISHLMRSADRYSQDLGKAAIVSFANRRFSQVLRQLFGWQILGYLVFTETTEVDLKPYQDRTRFQYGDAWYSWKFGSLRPYYVKTYVKEGWTYTQLLKTRAMDRLQASAVGVPRLQFWDPAKSEKNDSAAWSQPFSIKCLLPHPDPRLLDIDRWLIEMGDSDTFEYGGL